MRTALFLISGFLLLAAFTLLGRLFSENIPARTMRRILALAAAAALLAGCTAMDVSFDALADPVGGRLLRDSGGFQKLLAQIERVHGAAMPEAGETDK